MKICNVALAAGFSFLIFGSFLFLSCWARDEEFAFVEDDVDEAPFVETAENKAERCCSSGTGGLLNTHYLLVSTMDGKITALDVNSNGRVAWSANADTAPLLSGTLSSRQLTADGHPYMLVPSLDGSLYMFNMENNALNPVPMNTAISVMIGEDAVAGGTILSSTGVDPITGQVRYHCSTENCEQRATTNQSPHTLIIRRTTQIARAADPVTGSERWNLSVAEYTVSLVSLDRSLHYIQEQLPTHIRFRLRPPDGIISAINSCGAPIWENELNSPIAKVWQMANGRITEISLFSSENVETLSAFGGNVPKFEAPFYFGTVNSEPYIIPSDNVRSELRRFALTQESAQFQPYGADLTHATRSLYLHDISITNLIKRSYRNTLNAIEADQTRKHPSGHVTINSDCQMNDAIAVVSNRELQRVGYGTEERDGDLGWFVFKPINRLQIPVSNVRQPANGRMLDKEGRCEVKQHLISRLKEKLNIDEPVSGWWRVCALSLCCVVLPLIAMFTTYICVRKYRRQRLSVNLGGSQSCAEPNDPGSRPTVAETEVPQNKTSSNQSFPGKRNERRGISTTSSAASQAAATDPFVSKFLEDFIPEKLLGRGAYGVVFNCRHRLDDRSYAVKRIAVSNTCSAIERVKREAKAMAKLDHPGIIRYFHTWMERPPEGWQSVTDKLILANMHKTVAFPNNSSAHSSEGGLRFRPEESGPSKVQSLKLAPVKELSSLSSKIENDTRWEAGDVPVGASASGSWADDGSAMEDEEHSLSNNTDSSLDEGSIHASVPTVHQVESGDSSDVVFAGETQSRRKSRSGGRNSSSGPLEPPVVLVANETDLKTCKKTKDYIYLYIQMELCQELTLHNWLLVRNREEDRDLEQMRNWIAQLVCAIDYIHDRGLIHRDLKPQNIFFSADGSGSLKIGDLGLATNFGVTEGSPSSAETNSNGRHTGNVGTRLYMSPEQLKGRPYNQKIDVFSLGLIFAELLIPFKTVMERSMTLTKLQNGILPKQHLRNLVSERKFILWLTTLDAERRPSCREIMENDYLREEVECLGMQFTRERPRGSFNFGKNAFKAAA